MVRIFQNVPGITSETWTFEQSNGFFPSWLSISHLQKFEGDCGLCGCQLLERSGTEITVVLKKNVCPLLLWGNSMKRMGGDTSCFRNSWQAVTGPTWVALAGAALQGRRISYISGFSCGRMCSLPLGRFAAASVRCIWFLCWLIWNKILFCLPYLSRSFETLWGGNPLIFFP